MKQPRSWTILCWFVSLVRPHRGLIKCPGKIPWLSTLGITWPRLKHVQTRRNANMTDPIRYAYYTTKGQITGRGTVALHRGGGESANQAARRGVQPLLGRRQIKPIRIPGERCRSTTSWTEGTKQSRMPHGRVEVLALVQKKWSSSDARRVR